MMRKTKTIPDKSTHELLFKYSLSLSLSHTHTQTADATTAYSQLQ